jgi:acyl-CoA reductase-like NAD-dependent aldehyde dehydrogenase
MPPIRPDGFYFEPTVFTDVRPDMRIAQEEIFGPVLSVLGYRTYDEAIEIANGTPYGLAASVYTDDVDLAERTARRLRAGTVAHRRRGPVAVRAVRRVPAVGNRPRGRPRGHRRVLAVQVLPPRTARMTPQESD